MSTGTMPTYFDAFISYSSHNRPQVIEIATALRSNGVSLWRDGEQIRGGQCYGLEIVDGIKHSKMFVLMCTKSSMASKNVLKEVNLAWDYNVPFLPLRLERCDYNNLQYWLVGVQWIDILSDDQHKWLPEVLAALNLNGDFAYTTPASSLLVSASDEREPASPLDDLKRLIEMAAFNDKIWPVSAVDVHHDLRPALRDMGAPQEHVKHRFRLGDRVRLAIESDRDGHLLLLNLGTTGTVYCLCPSIGFSPSTQIQVGCTYIPQTQGGARYTAFQFSGKAGREVVLALLTRQPLQPGWISQANTAQASYELKLEDIDELLIQLRGLPHEDWSAFSTYFDVAD